MSRVPLITGQDGAYLTELLLSKRDTVRGLIRRASAFHMQRIDHLYQDPHDPDPRVYLHDGDLSGLSQLTNLFYEVRPEQEAPGDLVFGSGETHSVQQFVEETFGYVNVDWRAHVAVDPRYFRPTEVEHLQADPSEAKRRLQWEPRVRFRELVRIMMDADLEAAGLPTPGKGKRYLPDGQLAWLRRP